MYTIIFIHIPSVYADQCFKKKEKKKKDPLQIYFIKYTHKSLQEVADFSA